MQIQITDVFLRDGLQDEPVIIDTERKLEIAAALGAAGVCRMEVASFVNPVRVPQMADATDILQRLPQVAGLRYTSLALNGKGISRAAAAGATEVQVVASASQAHSAANAGASIDEALESLAIDIARHPQLNFSAGISTAFTCPFEGEIDPARVLKIVSAFKDMGIKDIGLADTLGTTAPQRAMDTMKYIQDAQPDLTYYLHLHNAHGRALETVALAIDSGITRFDAALGGFGGCPFAPGAAGNLSTLELVQFIHAHGHETRIDEGRLKAATDLARFAVGSGRPVNASELSTN
ncbi:hydroxymethylglutaryl-CoA lyase [Glutamicibacter sp. TV12E]|uniref:hydroxymethylglutaryl-CoA lyase n=1 Tax=Glutamicibacter sp. TV12E TaxID=3446362 RepID=UPI0040340DF6